MKIAIIGYGKMGKEIEQAAQNLGVEVSRIIDSEAELLKTTFSENEIAIEFTAPSSCVSNIEILSNKGVGIVCGSTGWHTHLDRVKKIVEHNRTGFIYSDNFSIGVNVFWKIIKAAASIINHTDQYDVMGNEIHHKNKKDTPSGTALHTANILLQNIDRKNKIITNPNKEILPNEIHFSGTRGGDVIGEHTVLFDSIHDTIKINHTSKSRESYAIGAIKSAQWLYGKKGFFHFHDHLEAINTIYKK